MAGRYQTDMGGTQKSFLTTHWSWTERIQAGEDQDSVLIGSLLQMYWKPVYCYLRRKGYENERAKDLTQDSFHEIVLNRDLVGRADPGNQDIDTRTDVYSLGVVLYELIAGVLPFDPQSLREHGIDGARKVICEQDPPTPSTRLSRTSVEESTKSAERRRTNVRQWQRSLRGDLDWITLKAMEKDRTPRYPSAGESAADVLRHLNHEPVAAGRPGLAYKARKFVRRNRALVAGLAAVLAVLVAAFVVSIAGLAAGLAILVTGIVVSLAFAVRAQRARSEATVIARFLEDVLAAIDGWDREGRQTTIKDVLDAASRKVSDEFGKAPLVEAAVWQRLGTLYLRVEAPEEAMDPLRRSLDIFTRTLGREAPQTLEIVQLLGQASWLRWQFSEAEEYFSQALAGRRRVPGPRHPDTLRSMAWRGWAVFGNGQADRAELLLSEAYETTRRTLGDHGPAHPITILGRWVLGVIHREQGRCDEADDDLEIPPGKHRERPL